MLLGRLYAAEILPYHAKYDWGRGEEHAYRIQIRIGIGKCVFKYKAVQGQEAFQKELTLLNRFASEKNYKTILLQNQSKLNRSLLPPSVLFFSLSF